MRKSDFGPPPGDDDDDPPLPPDPSDPQFDPYNDRNRPTITGPRTNMARWQYASDWASSYGNESQRFDAEYGLQQAIDRLARAERALGERSGQYAPEFSGPAQDVQKWQQIMDQVNNAAVKTPEQVQDAQYRLAIATERLRESQERMLNMGKVGAFSGPAQDVQKWRETLDQLLRQGAGDAQIFDARFRLRQAEKRLDEVKQEPSEGFLKNLADTILPRRWRAVTDIPLPPKLANLLNRINLPGVAPAGGGAGGGGAASALATAVSGSAARGTLGAVLGRFAMPLLGGFIAFQVGKALWNMSMQAAKDTAPFRRAQTMTGGTPFQIASLRAMGVDPMQAVAESASLRQRLFEDPFAVMASMRIGGGGMVAPRWTGRDVNEATILQKHLELLRKITNAEEQLYEARQLGLEGMLDNIRVSDRQWKRVQDSATATGNIQHEGVQVRMRDAVSQWDLFLKSGENFRTVVGAVFIPAINEVLGLMTYLNNWTAEGISRMIPGGQGGNGGALNNNTNALNRNTQALNNTAGAGAYGGGRRLRGAIPPGMRGEFYRQAAVANKFRWGAFGA